MISGLGIPFGVEYGSIVDHQITASSQVSSNRASWHGRLNNNSYWEKANKDSAPWIQVALSSAVTITAIQTQGATNKDSWVKELQIQTGYSEDTLSYVIEGSQPFVSFN